MRFIKIFPIVFISLALISCGDSGDSSDDNGIVYTGSRTEATINVDNVADLTIAAAGSTAQAIASDAASAAAIGAIQSTPLKLALSGRISEQLEQNLAANDQIANQSIAGLCVPGSGSADFNQNSSGTNGSIVFRNCEVAGSNGEVLNGRVTINISLNDIGEPISFNFRFINFSVIYLDKTQTLNMNITCGFALNNCSIYSDYVGLDGRTYRVEIDYVDDNIDGYFDLNATIYDPEHGFINVTTTTSITYNDCPFGVPATGTIVITDSTGPAATIQFDGCLNFSVTLNGGVPESYEWAVVLAN